MPEAVAAFFPRTGRNPGLISRLGREFIKPFVFPLPKPEAAAMSRS